MGSNPIGHPIFKFNRRSELSSDKVIKHDKKNKDDDCDFCKKNKQYKNKKREMTSEEELAFYEQQYDCKVKY